MEMSPEYPIFYRSKFEKKLKKKQNTRDVLAIVEGRFGVPVKRSGRFINANYPPDDMSMEELERI
jgi:hypothetical protein